jgi:hypothetical protein
VKLDLSGQPLEFQDVGFLPGCLFQTRQGTYHLYIASAGAGRVSVLTFDKKGELTGVQTYGELYLNNLRYVGVVDMNLKPEWMVLR